ncbi:MAG: OmpA family protein [Gemmatimonadota bacterium]|nr:MAG: OmpA family protein [Gemmatimonadota bacterium]
MSQDQGPETSSQDIHDAIASSEGTGQDFSALRELLIGDEKRVLEELQRRIAALETPEELAAMLPDAVALRTAQDKKLARALSPTIDEAISEAVQRNPQQITQAIFPIIGPAIRKAIAETMAGFVNTLNRAIEHSLSFRGLRWRIEAWRSGVPYAQVVIKHALVYRVEQLFLIHRETGLPLTHVAQKDLDSQDADLVSGMLTAIRDFVSDSFDAGSEAGLRTFTVGEVTVLVEAGPRALLAAIVRGQHPAEFIDRLQGTLETIHLQFATALNQFNGDAAPFEATVPLLEACLDTVLTTDRPGIRRGKLRIAWGIAFAILALLAVLAIRSSRRWNRALESIEHEPGIILVEANRGFRRPQLRGMRDPLAANPMMLLAQMGVDSSRVNAVWEPYLSFDSSIVIARARTLLDPPPSLELELRDNVMLASGTAPADWLARSSRLATQIPGVEGLDLSAVTLSVPNDLRDLASQIEQRRILFNVGSAVLAATARNIAAEVADSFRHLQQLSGDALYYATLNILGRTDTTGSNETNRVLSQERARNVVALLASLGIAEDMMSGVGIGTTDPIVTGDPVSTARVNRSATFVVEFRPDTGGARRLQ